MAADHHDIAAQFIAVASNEGVFGGRTGIGHEQEAEAFEVNAGDDALVVGLAGGGAGLRVEKVDGRVFSKAFDVTGQGERFSASGRGEGGVEIFAGTGSVAQGGVDDAPWSGGFEGKDRAAEVIGIAMGDHERIEPGDAGGAQGGFDDAAEIAFRSGVEQPGLFPGAHELRSPVAEVEHGEPRGGLHPTGRKLQVGSGQRGGAFDDTDKEGGESPRGIVEDGGQPERNRAGDEGEHRDGEYGEGEGHREHIGRNGEEREEMEDGDGERQAAEPCRGGNPEGRGEFVAGLGGHFLPPGVKLAREKGIGTQTRGEKFLERGRKQKDGGDDAERHLESRRKKLVGVLAEQEQGRRREAVGRRNRAVEKESGKGDREHDGGADAGRRSAGDQRVEEKRRDNDEHRTPPAQAERTEQEPEQEGHHADVQSAHAEQMVGAGAAEGVRIFVGFRIPRPEGETGDEGADLRGVREPDPEGAQHPGARPEGGAAQERALVAVEPAGR